MIIHKSYTSSGRCLMKNISYILFIQIHFHMKIFFHMKIQLLQTFWISFILLDNSQHFNDVCSIVFVKLKLCISLLTCIYSLCLMMSTRGRSMHVIRNHSCQISFMIHIIMCMFKRSKGIWLHEKSLYIRSHDAYLI